VTRSLQSIAFTLDTSKKRERGITALFLVVLDFGRMGGSGQPAGPVKQKVRLVARGR